MKINELRELLAASEPERISKAFGECYKKLAKSKKEELDPLIRDILSGKEPEKNVRKSAKTMDFTELSEEIDTFLYNAYADNYFAPNKVIPKERRSKWRFEAKDFLKALIAVNETDENFDKSVIYLTKLFDVFSYGCRYHVFSGYDTFRSIGMEQEELFAIVVSRRLISIGYTEENLKTMLWTAAYSGISADSLHKLLTKALIQNLRTTDSKYLAIEAAKELIAEKKKLLLGESKYSNKRYWIKSGIKEVNLGIMCLAAELGEIENHIDYYFKNYPKYDIEVGLYILLDGISYYGTEKDWLWVYSYGVKKLKIDPREELEEKYKELTEKNS